MNPSPSIDEPVQLMPYDPAWPGIYDQERFRIALAFGRFPSAGLIQHIGSTAVPGLAAKPVVDIMLGTREWPPDARLIDGLTDLGYEDLGEAGVPGRHYLRLRGSRDFNVHVVQRHGDHWANNLALRELLRADVHARERYAAAKQVAMTASGGSLLAYSAVKQPVLTDLIAKARAEYPAA